MNKPESQLVIQDRFLDQPYTLAGRLIDPMSGALSWQHKRQLGYITGCNTGIGSGPVCNRECRSKNLDETRRL